MFIQENIQTKVAEEYDVAVCGGGIGGIAAALAATRQGKKTVLFERQFVLGGLGTAGLITIYLPLCDGYGHQVSFGIAEELLRLSISCGAEDRYPANWLDGIGTRTEKDNRFEVQYNPHLFAISAEKLLLDHGVTILYGTYAVGVTVENEKIKYIITENKSGRQAYRIKSVVDATGDCDIAVFANAPTNTYQAGNILAGWYYSCGKEGYRLHKLSFSDKKDADGKLLPLVPQRFFGIDGNEISQQVCMSHKTTFEHLMKQRETDPSILPVNIASIPQIRMTRKIVGEYVLSDTEMHQYFDDSIGMVSDWRKRGPVYEVPFRTLYSAKVKNLICAGRCTSVDEPMWDIMRVIPCCAVTGQAAGTAAAMTDDFSSLDVTKLQKILEQDGVVLHEKEII